MSAGEKILRLVTVAVLLASAIALIALGERGISVGAPLLGALIIGRRAVGR